MGISGGRAAQTTKFAAPLIVLLAIAGCAAPEPEVAPTPQQSETSMPPAPEQEEAAGPFAAVTLAGVDVDGANFTVGGFVGGVSEDGGTCTYALTAEVTGVTVTATTVGVANAATTSCGSAQVPMSELSRGPWSIQLDYVSSTTDVSSLPVEVDLP